MFPPPRTSKLAQRALGALRVAHSFLLLEDDHEVDWEVDQDEPTPPPHPHRGRRAGGALQRRPGTPVPTYHVCLSPVECRGTLHARGHAPRAQESGGSARARGTWTAVPGADSTR